MTAAADYDLILMDIQMPGSMASPRPRRFARPGPRRPARAIIALSANAMTHQVREYLEAGMDLHVAKPIQLGRLHEALERVLAKAANAKAA